MNRQFAGLCIVFAAAIGSGCVDEPRTVLGRLTDSQQLSAEALLQFAKVTEAGNRSVMADSPDAAAVAASDLSLAMDGVTRDTAALATDLKSLSYTRETALLEEFQKRFAEFRALEKPQSRPVHQ